MAVRTVTKYICDICEEEFDSQEDVTMIELPCKRYNYEDRNYTYHFNKLDLCKTCKDKYVDSVMTNFAEISEQSGDLVVSRRFTLLKKGKLLGRCTLSSLHMEE